MAVDQIAPMMCAQEVAKVLRLRLTSVWAGARSGALPAVRIGRLVRFPRAAIEAIASGQPSTIGVVDRGLTGD